jgi:hypothetical protein
LQNQLISFKARLNYFQISSKLSFLHKSECQIYH